MDMRGHTFFGVTAVLLGSTFLGVARNQADARRDEMRELRDREAEIVAKTFASHEEWREAWDRWLGGGEVGPMPVLPPDPRNEELVRIQLRISELKDEGR